MSPISSPLDNSLSTESSSLLLFRGLRPPLIFGFSSSVPELALISTLISWSGLIWIVRFTGGVFLHTKGPVFIVPTILLLLLLCESLIEDVMEATLKFVVLCCWTLFNCCCCCCRCCCSVLPSICLPVFTLKCCCAVMGFRSWFVLLILLVLLWLLLIAPLGSCLYWPLGMTAVEASLALLNSFLRNFCKKHLVLG